MICSLTAYNRPEHLRDVFRSLWAARRLLDEPLTVVARVEPSDKQPDVLYALQELRQELGQGAQVVVSVNGERLQLQENTYAVLTDAWRIAGEQGEDFVLHLEDDLLVAPDGLRLAAWMRDAYRDDYRVPFVGLTSIIRPPPEKDWLRVWRTRWFDCHVWGTWLPVWEHELEPLWNHDNPTFWAANVNERIMRDRHQVLPCLARSRSIGVYGQHCNPDFHARHNPQLYAGDVDVAAGEYFEDGDWPEGRDVTTVIDVGCQTYGADESMMKLIERFQPGLFYGFDPSPDLHEGTTAIAPGTHSFGGSGTTVILRRAAAWISDGSMAFTPAGLRGTTMAITRDSINVPCVDLARFIDGLEGDIVLKLDCEGAEYPLLHHLIGHGLDRKLKLLLVEWHDLQASSQLERAALLKVLRCPIEEW